MAKSQEATPFGSKDPSSNTLHFKSIFDPPLKKVIRKAHTHVGGALVRLGDFLANASVFFQILIKLKFVINFQY